ncbi:MAG TPA: S53 family peptidase [Bryobacteraceae bacterium]|jgi:kumamolisin|nr:S53 family peptidase [Bryobacteraceae bacterium]
MPEPAKQKQEPELTGALEQLLLQEPASRQYLSIEEFLHRHGALAYGGEQELEAKPASAHTHRMHVRHLDVNGDRREMEAVDVARHYLFPEPADLRGQCIGLLELGGGFHESDVETYWKACHLPRPDLSIVTGRNRPAPSDAIADYIAGKSEDAQARWTVEVTLDIQLASAFAPGARLAVYFAPDSDEGQYQALLAALTDTVNRPSVISISFGGPEHTVSEKWSRRINRLLQAAALMGVTVCAASGDLTFSNETKDYIPPGHNPKTVSFPGSSPYVLSCGGSHLPLDERESVWYEPFRGFQCSTVGGVSSLWEEPKWQSGAGIRDKVGGLTGRGVPDVAGKADLAGGYRLFAGGKDISMGGTSASAPMWAALIANLNAQLKTRLGLVTPLFYSDVLGGSTHQIHHGTNGVWEAGPGWNPCTGLGSPKGTHLLKALQEVYPQALRAG